MQAIVFKNIPKINIHIKATKTTIIMQKKKNTYYKNHIKKTILKLFFLIVSDILDDGFVVEEGSEFSVSRFHFFII